MEKISFIGKVESAKSIKDEEVRKKFDDSKPIFWFGVKTGEGKRYLFDNAD